MDAQTAVALVSALLTTIIAVAVPVTTFRLALRQDAIRWLREQRAQLYVDLLAEAHAEQPYLEFAMADEQTREAARDLFTATDTRLSPSERARLGAGGAIFGTQTVNRLFNRLMAEGGQALLNFDQLPRARRNYECGCVSAASWTSWRRRCAMNSAQTVSDWRRSHPRKKRRKA